MPRDSEARFQAALALGNLGERLVAGWLMRAKGAGIVPAFDYKSAHGGPPKLWVKAGGHVLPDLDVCGDQRIWLEVKTYHGPAFNRSRQAWVHGFAARLIRSYQKVEELSRTPVWVAVLETHPEAPFLAGTLLVAPLSRIVEASFGCQCRPCKRGLEGICAAPRIKRATYWPRDVMREWHRFAPEEIAPVLAAMSDRDQSEAA